MESMAQTTGKAGQLAGRVAIITGASRGVGAEVARVYAREGACVVVNYFKSKEVAETLSAELNAKHGDKTAVALYGDVTSKEDMVALFARARDHFGQSASVVVNNALLNYRFDPSAAATKIATLDWATVDAQMRGSVLGAVNTTQAALPGFEVLGYGKVVMIGTNLVYNPVVTYYDYTCAKAALVGLTRNLAAELGPMGVRVNLIAGGLLETTDASSLTTPEVFGYVAGVTPLRRPTTVSDFAETTIFFASRASDAVTGQCISVDGGLTMP